MHSTALLVLSSGTALVAGITPSGFTPASNTDLMVVYGQVAATNGVLVDKAATATAPTIATKAQLKGTSYAVIMIDLDIPSTQNPHTFLHWMQTGLTPATAASTMTTANGTQLTGFSLTNAKNTSALVAYTQPGPPAQNPLSHRYTEVLVDTSALSQTGLASLQKAAQTRVGFDINTVLQSAGLANSVVAGNSFNVSNPGPVTASTGASTSTAAKNNGTTTTTGGKGKGGKNGKGANNGTASATGGDNQKGGKKGTGSQTNGTATAKGSSNGTAVSGSSATSTNGGLSNTGASNTGASNTGASNTGASNNGASSANGTATATISGASSQYILYPVTLLLSLTGALFWAF